MFNHFYKMGSTRNCKFLIVDVSITTHSLDPGGFEIQTLILRRVMRSLSTTPPVAPGRAQHGVGITNPSHGVTSDRLCVLLIASHSIDFDKNIDLPSIILCYKSASTS